MSAEGLLHEISPHGPHACPFPVDVHRNRCQETGNLNTTDGHEDIFRAISFEPVVKEEREDPAMKDVFSRS